MKVEQGCHFIVLDLGVDINAYPYTYYLKFTFRLFHFSLSLSLTHTHTHTHTHKLFFKGLDLKHQHTVILIVDFDLALHLFRESLKEDTSLVQVQTCLDFLIL